MGLSHIIEKGHILVEDKMSLSPLRQTGHSLITNVGLILEDNTGHSLVEDLMEMMESQVKLEIETDLALEIGVDNRILINNQQDGDPNITEMTNGSKDMVAFPLPMPADTMMVTMTTASSPMGTNNPIGIILEMLTVNQDSKEEGMMITLCFCPSSCPQF